MDSTKNRKIIVITIAIVVLAVILFFIIANNVIVDECASPCRHTDGEVCIAMCDKVTLLDWIFGDR